MDGSLSKTSRSKASTGRLISLCVTGLEISICHLAPAVGFHQSVLEMGVPI